jgi:hypothetical protein
VVAKPGGLKRSGQFLDGITDCQQDQSSETQFLQADQSQRQWLSEIRRQRQVNQAENVNWLAA